MSTKQRRMVAVFRRRTAPGGGSGAREGWTLIAVQLGRGKYGLRQIYHYPSGKVRRGQWTFGDTENLIRDLAFRSRAEMWDSRNYGLRDGVDMLVDFVPRYGIVELPGEDGDYTRFGQPQRRAAMEVVDDEDLLPVLPVGKEELQKEWNTRAQSIVAEMANTLHLSGPLHKDLVAARKKAAPAARAEPRIPRTKAVPLAPAVAEERDYPEIRTDGGARYVQLAHGRHYLRKMGTTGVDDVDMLRKGRESFSPVLLLGESGVGKTQAVQAAFGDHNIITVLGHEEVEAASFEGRYVPREGGGWQRVIGKLVRAMQEGKVLFIDEIALISALVLSILYSAMDGRRTLEPTLLPDLGTITAQPGFYVCGAANQRAPGARIADAMRSRFPHRPVVTTDYGMAVKHLGVPRAVANAGANLEDRRAAREIGWAPQMRDLAQFVQAVEDFNEDFALSSMAGKAPESDQRIVCEVLSREVGRRVRPLATA